MMTNEEKLELAKKIYEEQTGFSMGHGHGSDIALEDFVLAYTSAIEEKYQAQIAMLNESLKPSYIFYMIEVERVGWLAGRKEGQLHFTHSVEDAITFFDRHSAEIILAEFFGSAASYMHPTSYGRVSVTEHMWCNGPSATQATADAFIAEVKAKALEEAAIWFDAEEYVTYTIKNGVISHEDYAEFQLRRMAAELRNQQEGKEGGE